MIHSLLMYYHPLNHHSIFCTNLLQACLFNACTEAVTYLSVFLQQRYTQDNQSHFIKQTSLFFLFLFLKHICCHNFLLVIVRTAHFSTQRFTNCGTECYKMLGKAYLLPILLHKLLKLTEKSVLKCCNFINNIVPRSCDNQYMQLSITEAQTKLLMKTK